MRSKLLEERDCGATGYSVKVSLFELQAQPAKPGMKAKCFLTVDDWAIAEEREVEPRSDRPIVAVDLGGGRSWSAAVAIWQSLAGLRPWPWHRVSLPW